MNDLDPIAKTAEDLKRGGWIMALLGAAGAMCRLLLAETNYPVWTWVRRILAGAMFGILCYFGLHGLIDPIYEAVVYSVSGAIAPEVMELVVTHFPKLMRRLFR
jgi:hypothetical protein